MGKTPQTSVEAIYLKQWMKACGVKQHELVKATGYSQSYISNLGRGEKDGPSADFVRRTAKYLRIGMDDLYREPGSSGEISAIRAFWEQARTPPVREIRPKRR